MVTTAQDVGAYPEKELRAKGKNAVMFYGQLVKVFPDLPEFTGAWSAHPLCDMFGELDIDDGEQKRPFRTAIVVAQETGIPGGGFFTMYAKYREPGVRLRNEMDKITVHQRELGELARYYGHP
jgi:hypothetical protein